MKIYLFLGLILQVLATHGMETQKEIKPLGIKNFAFPQLNLAGICGHIAKFQLLKAGFHAVDAKKYKSQDNLLWIIAQRYKKQQREQPNHSFIITPIEIEEVSDEKGIHKVFNKYCANYTWDKQKNTNSIIKNKELVYEKPEELDSFLQKKLNKYSSTDQKPLVIINLTPKENHLCTLKTLGALENTIKPTFKSTYHDYQLVGVAQQHNYSLRNNALITDLNLHCFYSFPSGRFLMIHYNPLWRVHFDAYVQYNNSWYVLDDETRWKVSTENNGNAAEALIECYPGRPRVLVYAPKKLTSHTPTPTHTKEHSLTLTRDTKEPSRLKSGLALIGGALCDGIAVGLYMYSIARGTAYVLGENSDTKKDIKLSSIVGLVTSCISMAYHRHHILAMHKSQITYNKQSPHKELGPRAN